MDIDAWLEGTFGADDYAPPAVPQVVYEVARVANDPKVTTRQITRLLSKDPIITGRILKLVQSPLYAGRVKVTSLERAVTRIGLRKLREVIWEVALGMRVFRSRGYATQMNAIRRHSVATGYLTAAFAETLKVPLESPLLCGLMHDCGIAGAIVCFDESPAVPDTPRAWSSLGRTHAALSRRMIEIWRLPGEVRQSAMLHHEAPDPGVAPGAAVVCVADAIATELGFPGLPTNAAGETKDATPVERLDHLKGELGIGPGDWARLREEGAQVLRSVGETLTG